MNNLILFTDGSVNPQLKVGYGAYFVTTDLLPSPTELSVHIKIKRFEQTSSTRLELQTLLWALKEIQPTGSKLTIYTDSQNIIGLLDRRAKLELNAFCSRANKPLNNADLYREFYLRLDALDCTLVKVSGHLPVKEKNCIDQHFSLVDQASRKALKNAGDLP